MTVRTCLHLPIQLDSNPAIMWPYPRSVLQRVQCPRLGLIRTSAESESTIVAKLPNYLSLTKTTAWSWANHKAWPVFYKCKTIKTLSWRQRLTRHATLKSRRKNSSFHRSSPKPSSTRMNRRISRLKLQPQPPTSLQLSLPWPPKEYHRMPPRPIWSRQSKNPNSVSRPRSKLRTLS